MTNMFFQRKLKNPPFDYSGLNNWSKKVVVKKAPMNTSMAGITIYQSVDLTVNGRKRYNCAETDSL